MKSRYLSVRGAIGGFALVALAYLAFATFEIALPGIYMDAVNPDYLVVRWLNPTARFIPSWLAPGNDIAGRYPLLVGLHHGSLQLWLGYPAYWLFGMTVNGLRLTHAMFGLTVLAAWFALQRSAGTPRGWTVAIGAALAVDPSFVYAFRTQGYITMAPVALLLLGVLCLLRARASEGGNSYRWLFGCGWLSGLACWGYFVYAFFVPVLLICAWFIATDVEPIISRLKRVGVVCAGIAVGGSLYVLGYALMIVNTGGLAGAWSHVTAVQPSLGIAGASVSLDMRLQHVMMVWRMVVSNAWHHALMFADDTPTVGADWKFGLLVLVPFALWIWLEMRRLATALLRIALGLQISFLFGATLFGTRLAGHHFMPMVPLIYAGLAASIDAVRRSIGAARAFNIVAGGAVAVILALNVIGDVREVDTLRRTGGVANYSDAINRLGADLLAGDHNRLLILPDWGLYMPTAFLTQATMEMASHDDYALARQRLCEGKDVVVGLIAGERAARFLEWQRKLDWTAPEIRAYHQRDGNVVFEVGTFSGRHANSRCGSERETR